MTSRGLSEEQPGTGHTYSTLGVFCGPWDTGWDAKDGAVLGFEAICDAFTAGADAGDFKLLTTSISVFRDYQSIRTFLEACDTVYANCGPWAALLHLVRERENLDVTIIREVRTVGWIGYIWQEEVALQLERTADQRVFPSRYARDIWGRSAPSVAHSRIYYPMTSGVSSCRPTGKNPCGVAGFFSALRRDKGFDSLPEVLYRLLASGHPVERLILAGQQSDPDLFASVTTALSDIGVTVDFRGSLPNQEVRTVMAECDFALFLSVSSIESLGRVIVESSEQGVPVITTDYGAARDLIREDYRIPVDYLDNATGLCDSEFPVARLDVSGWQPPVSLSPETCFLQQIQQYAIDPQSTANLLRPPTREMPATAWPITFCFQGDASALSLAEELVDNPDLLMTVPDDQLLDLGGALKRFLLSRGYNPRVSFETVTLVKAAVGEN